MTSVGFPLCAIDLDDTLLGPDHSISVRNMAAVKAASQLGVTVVIASGRMHEATLRYANELELQGPVISYNGALIKTAASGEEWLHERVPADVAAEIVAYSAERNLQLNFYFEGRIHSVGDTPWLQLYHSRTGSPYTIDPAMAVHLRGVSPTKLIIVDTPELTNSLLTGLQDRYQGVLYVTKTTDEYLEMMPANANKGAALACVASRLGLNSSETVAIGDSYNDVPMVRWAGLGLAVSNAKPELLAAADRTIGRYDEDGVAVALEALYNLTGVKA